MLIDLNSELTLRPYSPYKYRDDREHVISATIEPATIEDHWSIRNKPPNDKESFVRTNLPVDADMYHSNYIKYMASCWAQHYSITISPDIIWFSILNEIAKGVIKYPDQHKDLFTKSPEKVKIFVPVESVTDPLPLSLIIDQLTSLVPIDIGLFLPKFSTTDDMARLTHLASFAETVTPYYSYMTYLCGFPSIKVDGTIEDYTIIESSISRIADEFRRVNSPLTKWADFAVKWAYDINQALNKKDSDFFTEMFSSKRCGSGGETTIDGWYSHIFREQPKGERKPENFPTQIARVPWENVETGRKFTLNCGLFSSRLNDGIMTPEFSWVQNEIKTA